MQTVRRTLVSARHRSLRRSGGRRTSDIVQLFPTQGDWSESEYLELDTRSRVEFTDGWLEVLDMPVMSHERIMVFLFQLAVAFVGPRELGEVMPAGVRLRLRGGKYRIADVAFMSAEHETRIHEEFWDGADLVMEVLSKGKVNRERDLTKKKKDYAMARIPEYWIVDPVRKLILVYELDGDTYRVHGRFRPGQQATSALLPGFAVDVAAVFAAAQRNRKK